MIRSFLLAASVPVALVVAACSTPVEPQLVTFDYQREPMSAAELVAVSNALIGGSVTLPDNRVASGPSCQFSSNVSQVVINDVDVNGDPNSGAANILLDATNDLTRASNDCPSAVSIEPYSLAIATANNVHVGQPVLGSGSATVEIDGETFSSQGLYFKFELTSYDGDYTTGEFEFIAKNVDNPADNRALVVFNGAFALDD
jgi:hypothetical protein